MCIRDRVIGGGDTGNDCQGTALRQGCTDLVALPSLLPTTTMKLMRRLGWNISHSGTKMSMCVDINMCINYRFLCRSNICHIRIICRVINEHSFAVSQIYLINN